MKIGLLTFKSGKTIKERKLPDDIRMLKEAALGLGHEVKIIRHDRCQLIYDKRKPRVLYNNKKFPDVDVVVPRVTVTNSSVDIMAAVVKQLELMSIPVVNKFSPIVRAKSKLTTLQILSHKGIPIPKTIVVRRFEYIDSALKRIGKMPVILKTPFGSLGVGVAIIETKRSLVSALDMLWQELSNNIILIQEYIRESEGRDIRAFVIGDKVVAAMKRTARRGDFRSNIHRGGTGKPVELTEQKKRLAVSAARALDLDIAGVDLLEKKSGPVVMEVNCNPGLEGISEVSGINIAEKIIKYALSKIKNKR